MGKHPVKHNLIYVGLSLAIIALVIILIITLSAKPKVIESYCGDKICNSDEMCGGNIPGPGGDFQNLKYTFCESDCGTCHSANFMINGCGVYVGSTLCEDAFTAKYPGVQKFACRADNCIYNLDKQATSDCTCVY